MINKNAMTVTMPLNEFEEMQEELEKLKKERLSNYLNYTFPKGTKNGPVWEFDQEKAIKDLAAAYPDMRTLNIKTKTGVLVQPYEVNGGIRIGDELTVNGGKLTVKDGGEYNATNN